MGLWLPTAIMFLFTGILELVFLLYVLVASASTGYMTLTGGWRGDSAEVMTYVHVWQFANILAMLVAGPLHIGSAVSILRGNRNRTLVMATTAASVLPLFTCYCAAPSFVSGLLGLLCVLRPDPTSATTSRGALP